MNNKINLEGLSVDDLLDLREQIDQRLEKLIDDEIDSLQKRMDRLANFKNAPEGAPSRAAKLRARSTKPNRNKGRKAPIKFRDPENGNSWSGRGLTPVWLREYEANGGDRANLAV